MWSVLGETKVHSVYTQRRKTNFNTHTQCACTQTGGRRRKFRKRRATPVPLEGGPT